MKNDAFRGARVASGLTVDEAANIAGVSKETYRVREKNPGSFRLDELLRIRNAMTEPARKSLDNAVTYFFVGKLN